MESVSTALFPHKEQLDFGHSLAAVIYASTAFCDSNENVQNPKNSKYHELRISFKQIKRFKTA